MRNLKKLLAVVVAICVLATFTIPAFAADETLAADTQTCADIGMLIGSGGGVTADYAATTPSRIQAAVMLLRLTGNYDEAAAFESEDNFADASDANWAKPLMAFLKAHPELGFEGVGADKFAPNSKITAQQYYKIVLTALGYEIPGDYEYANTLTFAEELGLAMAGDVEDFTVNALAAATVEGLKMNVKDGAATLAATLVEAGAIDKDAAVAADLYADELTATLAATGAKKLTVTFNQAVDKAKATFAVKKGTITVNIDTVEFAEDNKSAVITTTTNLTKGDYTVTVSGLTETAITATVTAEDVKVSKINITSTKAPRIGVDIGGGTIVEKNAKVNYEVLNQYDEKMKQTDITWTISTGKAVTNLTDSSFEIQSADGNAFIPGSIVYITGVHANSGTVVNTQVEVALASQADTVAFKGVYSLDKSKIVDLPAGFKTNKYVLLFDIVDQYGNTMTSAGISDLVFTSNNPLFVASTFDAHGSDIEVDDVDYAAVKLEPGIQVGKGGSVTIQAISKLTGKTSTFVIDADAAAAVKTFTISAPGKVVAEGEEIEIPFTALDQYGNEITKFESLDGKVTLSPAFNGTHGLEFVEQKDESAKLIYTADTGIATANADALVYLTTVVLDGGSNSSLMLTIKDEAVPTVIAGLDKELVTNVAIGGKFVLDRENIIVQDQYGRDFDLEGKLDTSFAAAGKYQIAVALKNVGDTKISLSAGLITADAGEITVTGATKGTSGIVISLNKVKTDLSGFEAVENSEYSRNVVISEKADFESYEIGELKPIYDSSNTAYARELIVYGIKADGSKVVVPSTEYSVTTNNTKLTYSADDLQSDGTIVDEDDVTVKVTVVVNAEDSAVVLTRDVVVTKPALTVAKAEWKDAANVKIVDGEMEVKVSEVVTTSLMTAALELKDQFDVAYTLANHSITFTNISKVEGSTIDTSNNGKSNAAITGTVKVGDSFNMTIAVDGKAYTIKVLVVAD